jgi:hypothetical protein
MDTSKWKSVLLPKDIYQEIVVISHVEGRTISGQLRIVYESWKNANLSEKDKRYIADEVKEFKSRTELPAKDESDQVFSLKRGEQ